MEQGFGLAFAKMLQRVIKGTKVTAVIKRMQSRDMENRHTKQRTQRN